MSGILIPKNTLHLAHTSLKSDLVTLDPPPKKNAIFWGVVLVALFSFIFDQISSEKVQNVANILKILWKKSSDHIYDLGIKKSIFIKKMLAFWRNFRLVKFEKKIKILKKMMELTSVEELS